MKPQIIAAVGCLSVASCANILSIDDAHVDPALEKSGTSSSTSGGASLVCQQYCDAVTTNCSGVFAVYTTKDTCFAICAAFETAPADLATNDPVGCRLQSAQEALTEPSFYCPAAGPGGNGVCGSNCASLCALASVICAGSRDPFTSATDCMNDCKALPDLGSFSTDDSKDMYEGASVECRLYHVSAAATADADMHCTHVGGAPPCDAGSNDGS